MTYAEQVLAPFNSIWSEAMLTATIHFIYKELGISNIYYHTYETGNKIKKIYGSAPRSLYSDLPKRFCFQQTNESPEFIKNNRLFIRKKRSVKQLSWYQLAI